MYVMDVSFDFVQEWLVIRNYNEIQNKKNMMNKQQ